MADQAGPAPPPLPPAEARVRIAHGTITAQPFGWMADRADPRLLAHLGAERDYYEAVTAGLGPLRTQLRAEFAARLPTEDDSVPWRCGRYLYLERTPAGAQFPQLCRRADRASGVSSAGDTGRASRDGRASGACGAHDDATDGEFEVVLDGGLIAAGTYLRFGVCEPSPDGRLVAYSVDFTGDEVFQLRFRDTASGSDLPDRIPRSYYGRAWSADSRAFFYVVHDVSFRPCRVFRHVIGTDPGADRLVYAEPDERYHVTVAPTRSGEWIVISAEARDTNEQWVIPADASDTPPRLVERRCCGIEYFVEHIARTGHASQAGPIRAGFVILTNDRAPEYRVVAAPTSAPGRANWRELVPGDPAVRFRRLDVVGSHLVLSCRAGGDPFLRIVRPDGSHHDQHPGIPAGVIEASARGAYDAAEVVVSTQSLVVPRRWWSVDLHTGERRLLRATAPPGYDEAAYLTMRLLAPAPDGRLIPVTIACRRGSRGPGTGSRTGPGSGSGTASGTGSGTGPGSGPGSGHRAATEPGPGLGDGAGPCLLYGYGAYEACADPRFSVTIASLLDRGYVYAIAHVRGGGELGRGWWLDGRLAAKRNTFTDFVAVRDHLVTAGWASPDRVACRGLSAGGLTVGVAYTFWPGRWAGVVAEAPAVDLLNQMLDPAIPLTVNEYDEWGDPAHEQQFAWMRSYTPQENVTDAPRPPLLVTGILHDPRVMISEPAKWVAALRAVDTRGNKILLRPELGPGAHRGPAGRSGSLAYEAEILAWVISLTHDP